MDDKTIATKGWFFELAAVIAVVACTAASCGPRHSISSGPRCAFADPKFTTTMGICYIAAEYYVANREWPFSKAQLEEQHKRLLDEQKAEMSLEEQKEIATFLDRFTRLDLRKSGDNLKLHYRFVVEGETVDQTVTLKPGSTASEILQAATP